MNINQLDPSFQALGNSLLDQVANPFFGNPAFGAFADQETISRGQLLRPYPQFGDLLAHQVSDGRAQYHSVVLRLERPIVNGWGGRVSYTYSRNKNNIFGETNAFAGASAQARAQNDEAGRLVLTAGRQPQADRGDDDPRDADEERGPRDPRRVLEVAGRAQVVREPRWNLQIVDVAASMKPLTKMTRQIVSAASIPSMVRDAFRVAMEERPGPVHLELPEDIAG